MYFYVVENSYRIMSFFHSRADLPPLKLHYYTAKLLIKFRLNEDLHPKTKTKNVCTIDHFSF